MENKNSSLKIALAYIAIFILIVLIAIPPIFRIVLKDTDNDNSTNIVESKTVLHCTRKEVVGSASYNVQVFNTYSNDDLEKVIIRYNRTGNLDGTNQNNQFEQEMANLRGNTNIVETPSTNGGKFEISKSILVKNSTDQVIGLYAKDLTSEEQFLTANNYNCEINSF